MASVKDSFKFNPPTGWIQPSPSLTSSVWVDKDKKDRKLVFSAFATKTHIKLKDTNEAKTYIKDLVRTRNSVLRFIGAGEWKVRNYNIIQIKPNIQKLDLQGTYMRNGRLHQYNEWIYFLPRKHIEIQISEPSQKPIPDVAVKRALSSLVVK